MCLLFPDISPAEITVPGPEDLIVTGERIE